MAGLKLIREYVDYKSLELVTEDIEGEKTYKIKGPFLQAEMKNRNGRIYPKKIIEREVNDYVVDKIKTNRAMGELDHPPTPSINLDRVSHIIESLEMVDNDGMGIAKILDTPTGRIAQSLLKSGIQLGVSTRGIGTLKGDYVNEDYKLLAIDIVADPSAPGAYVEGILENKEFIIEGNNYIEVVVNNLKKNLDKKGSKYIKESILEFLVQIRKQL